ncbi:MAG TPA: peptidylprolyl isomerase [Tepidisphaeraceae bacterium]|nr:peptidylprolyl isomerase [Tepidisphaeraceae bacterium]
MAPTLTSVLMLYSILVPQKVWFSPGQPLNVTDDSKSAIKLVLTDFKGTVIASSTDNVAAGKTVDLLKIFPALSQPATYVLYAADPAAATAPPAKFIGTPLVIEARPSNAGDGYSGVMVTKIEPLDYVKMKTEDGTIEAIFYYDSAPNTVDNFLTLSAGGYYDGLVFHRIVPDFVIQGGDPLGTNAGHAGTGGPGYHIEAEFNDRPHEAGVLSMARSSDVNSAGSQFFICLNYANTQSLDHKYTAFGCVISGMDVVKKIAAAPTDPQSQRPDKPPVIENIQVVPVTVDRDPYADLFAGAAAK